MNTGQSDKDECIYYILASNGPIRVVAFYLY